jgi:hypothetical protein
MTLQRIKLLTIAAWILAIGAASLILGVTSSSGWIALAALAIVPPIVMLFFWKLPDQTMSQSIQEELRK